jgi:hypothetical protein
MMFSCHHSNGYNLALWLKTWVVKLDGKDRSYGRIGFHPNESTVCLDYLFAEGQTQANLSEAFVPERYDFKRIEDPLLIPDWNAGPLVNDLDANGLRDR